MELSKVTQMITRNPIPMFGVQPSVDSKRKSDTELSFKYRNCLIAELINYKVEAEVYQ
jgi:hypothetical protein